MGSGTSLGVSKMLSVLQDHISRLQENQDKMLEALSTGGLMRRRGKVSEENSGSPLIPGDSGCDFCCTETSVRPPCCDLHLMGTTMKGFSHVNCEMSPSGPKPAMPSEFNGNRSHGHAFLNSVRWYMQVKGHQFHNAVHKISWTLSFMKTGRALVFANQVARQTDKQDMFPYPNWESFWHELEERFLPVNEADQAANILETDQYFQGTRSVDDYCDDFQELVDHAGYPEDCQVVMKFRKGLAQAIADQVAMLQNGRPKDDDLQGWIKTSKYIARLHIRNEAFNQLVRKKEASVNIPEQVPALPLLPVHVQSTVSKSSVVPSIRTTRSSVPLFSNRFACLAEEEIIEDSMEELEEPKPLQVKTVPTPPRVKQPKWIRHLPKAFTINAASNNQLRLDVEVQTTDTERTFRLSSLLDSGASGLFIDKGYVKQNNIPTQKLQRSIPVLNVDGTPNEAGAITEVVNLVLRYDGHSERAVFAVTSLGNQDMILGLPWLRLHNPEVDWQTGKVKMTRCNIKYQTCKLEQRKAIKEHRANARAKQRCRAGPMPQLIDVEEEEEEEVEVAAEVKVEEEEEIEYGDRIFATVIHPESFHIKATATISQKLAEAAAKLTSEKPKGFKEIVPEYLHDFEEVFSKTSFDSLPEHKQWDHAIELIPQAVTRSCKVYPLSQNEQVELDAFLEENLRTGRIRPSKSPMASPVFFIKKKDGSLRLVQDYRALNDITIKNRYPLPLISELVNQLRGAKYFTKLDVRWGYNNVRIKEGDEWKAAFRTNRGLFEPLVMFFGLTNSPATFQTMMNDIFRDLIAEGVVCVYLDDILIFTKTLAEHRRVTRLVLERLRQHKLFLKPEKCEFEQTSIEYLGLVVSQGCVSMDPVKVAGVKDWPVPTNRKEVQSFLGFVNFYRRFIQDFSHHARPLFDLTKKDTTWHWGESQQAAFNKLKELITSAPVLIFPKDQQPFRLEADSSDFATGAVLSQFVEEDGKWHPISFYSKSLSPVERNYEIHDKEMLAIVRALDEWRHWLEGAHHKFEIWTDHKNLEYFRTARKLNRRQARWSLFLSRFDYELHHRPGRSMGKPDALSRRADHGTGGEDNDNMVLLKPELFAIRALEGVETVGEEAGVLQAVRRGNKAGLQEDAVAAAAKELVRSSSRSARSSEWSMENGILFFRGKVYVPKDPELRRQIVAQHHDSKVAGHPGRWKTLELVSRTYWWPHMSRYIGQYTKTCDLCMCTKVQRQLPVGELHPLPIPAQRWEQISVDFIVELPEAHGYDAVMNVVDSVSKRAHFLPTHTTISAEGAARLYLTHVWKHHGLPQRVVSDRGVQFVAQFTKELYRLLGIKLVTSTAYHPQTDGQTERVNQELEQYLRLFTSERQDDWDELLPMAEFQYNNHVHASTKETPFMLDTGRHPRMGFEPRQQPSKLEAVNEFKERMASSLEEAKAALSKAQDDMARYYNQRRQPTPVFKPGDRVYLDASDIRTTRPSHKLSHRNLGPFEIVKAVGSHAYKLKLPHSMKLLHPVFPVVKLTIAPEDPIPGRRPRPPPPPVIVNGEQEWEVEEIINSRLFRNRFEYRVKWKGYGIEEASWEPKENVNAPRLVAKFHREHPGAPRYIRRVHFNDLHFQPRLSKPCFGEEDQWCCRVAAP